MPTGIDENILSIVRLSKEVDVYQISDQLRVHPSYVERICESLVEEGYLERTEKWEYRLAPRERQKSRGRQRFIVRY